MTTSYSTLLGLALPVQGELSGTWGTTVNDYITTYLDSAVAGTQTISGTQTAVTLSVTNGSTLVSAGAGATGSSQYMVINCTGTPASLLTITAPGASKVYVVINATAQSVKLVGAGPTAGVTLVTGEKAVCAWDGTDFVKVATSVADGVTSVAMTVPTLLSVSGSPITSTGTLALTYSGTALPVANGGTGLTSGTSGGLLAYTAAGTLASSTSVAQYGVIYSGGAGAVPVATANGTTGQAFIATTSGAPSWGTLGPAGGGTGIANNAASTLTVSGSFASTFTVSGAYNYTFPGQTSSLGYKNIPAVGTKTSSYTLATTDVGKYVQLSTSGSIIVPDATFTEGDAVLLFNNTSGAITLTMTITTAYIGGTDADKATISLATRGVANVFFISGTVCVVTGNVA